MLQFWYQCICDRILLLAIGRWRYNSLLSFDMSGEVFREIKGPQNPRWKDGHLVLHNDSLADILYQGSQPFWWSIDLAGNEVDKGSYFQRKPCTSVDATRYLEKTMTSSSRSVAPYDPSTNIHQIRELGSHSFGYTFDAFSYKESPVSLNGGNKGGEKYKLEYLIS